MPTLAMSTLKTSQNTLRLSSCAAILGTVLMASSTAMADDGPSKFETADADASGDLTYAEFRTMFPAKMPEEQVQNKFADADTSDDELVTLEEWNAFREEEKDETQKHTERFNHADLDDDGFLTYDEFIPLIPGKRPLIQVRKRFLIADADNDLLVSLDEWLDFKDESAPDEVVKFRKFDLADLDGDGVLTLDEFDTTFPRKAPAKTVQRKFNREDENDDGFISRDEWSPGTGKKPSSAA